MTRFLCGRFPSGLVPIRTAAGIVDFHDGAAEVDDAELAAALREVPAVFAITEEGGTELPSSDLEPEPSLTASALRKWAKANDIPCPSKGRVPQSVVRAYLTRRAEQE